MRHQAICSAIRMRNEYGLGTWVIGGGSGECVLGRIVSHRSIVGGPDGALAHYTEQLFYCKEEMESVIVSKLVKRGIKAVPGQRIRLSRKFKRKAYPTKCASN